MRRKRLHLVLFGPPGVGKSVQAIALAERFEALFIRSGDVFRAEIEEKTSLGRIAQPYVETGVLAPDEVANLLMKKQLHHIKDGRHVILDGYPYNVEQAEILDKDKTWKTTLAIQLKARDGVVLTRWKGRYMCAKCGLIGEQEKMKARGARCLSCGGSMKLDSTAHDEEAARHRFTVYHFATEPLAAYYRERGVLLAVNAEQPVQSLFEELVKKMAKLGFLP